MKELKLSVIISAAGAGTRLGASTNKTLLKIESKSVLERSLEPFLKQESVAEILISYREPDFNEYRVIVERVQRERTHHPISITLIEGGKERRDSVYHCLKKLNPNHDYVMIHDCARPFLPAELLRTYMSEIAAGQEAIIPYLPSPDTLLYVHKNKAGGELLLEKKDLSKIDRSLLLRIQTPQCFSMRLAQALKNMLENSSEQYSDESSAVLMMGEKIKLIRGSSYLNKITDAEDWEFARAIYHSFRSKENDDKRS